MGHDVTFTPINVDKLYSSRSELFPSPIPPLEKRRTVFIGELVKVAIGIREVKPLIAGRWVIVESISYPQGRLQAVGRSWKPHNPDDFSITFGLENIYRMEKRRFYIWGSGGIPVALRSFDGVDEHIPARPVDAQDQIIPECENGILEFPALGEKAARDHYRELASQNPSWPDYDDLR